MLTAVKSSQQQIDVEFLAITSGLISATSDDGVRLSFMDGDEGTPDCTRQVRRSGVKFPRW